MDNFCFGGRGIGSGAANIVASAAGSNRQFQSLDMNEMKHTAEVEAEPAETTVAEWKEIIAGFQQPSPWRAGWQVVNSIGLYAIFWALMVWSLSVSWWLTAAFVALAGLVLVRVFIIFHDCGHGSFVKSKRVNDAIGFVTGLLTFTPYFHWRWEHSLHHATSGDLDRRGVGDIWTMTVEEYLAASPRKRLAYRVARNPFVLFVLAPVLLFLLFQRIPNRDASAREKHSVWWMNLAILAMGAAMSWAIGWKTYVVLQILVMVVAGAAGIWMFYVQHQFEGAYWQRHDEWDYTQAALAGSSFYKLPRILQWFTGNIGFHHVHHLSARIPNYNLERCHNSHPMFRTVKPITLTDSLRCVRLRLWDEKNERLVGYRELRQMRGS